MARYFADAGRGGSGTPQEIDSLKGFRIALPSHSDGWSSYSAQSSWSEKRYQDFPSLAGSAIWVRLVVSALCPPQVARETRSLVQL